MKPSKEQEAREAWKSQFSFRSEPDANRLDFQSRLLEELEKRKQEHYKTCLDDMFVNGRFWEAHDIIELIKTLKP